MLFNAFTRSRLNFSNIQTRSTWRVARGAIDPQVAHVVWHDSQFAVVLPPDVDAATWTMSPNERFVLVGDVGLNQPETLWHQLDRSGPRPTTDLSLVAQLWETYGVDTWNLLIGMVNLVVWDRQEQLLWFGRDRVGARSLYYTTHGRTQWIAPQRRSLAPYHSQEIDPIALRDYLCCAFVPGERTMWQQVREVRPGTVIQPDGTGQAYWQLQEQIIAADQSLEWHGDRLRLLLDQVVQECLPAADQPVGVFLSGGLDSSCITALAAQHHAAPLHTYSIHFGDRPPHELEFSGLVAQHCQTQHHILEITFETMWQRLPKAMKGTQCCSTSSGKWGCWD